MQIPEVDSLDPFSSQLVSIFAATCWLPHPEVVSDFDGAVFPSVRGRKGNKREGIKTVNGLDVAMYDDNTTPRWAFLWSHGITSTKHPSSRTFAHVWESGDDVDAYTHLANIVMALEPLAGLTDKNGPLSKYLRWHSWSVYKWKPNDTTEPTKPSGYENVSWRYLPKIENARSFLIQRFRTLNNGRTRAMTPLIENSEFLNEQR